MRYLVINTFPIKGISRQLLTRNLSPQGKTKHKPFSQGYFLKKTPDPRGRMRVNFCLYIFMLLRTCLVVTINQGGRPSKPHMKTRFMASQSSQTGYNPGLCPSVTQENSQNNKKLPSLDFKASMNNCVGTYWNNVIN